MSANGRLTRSQRKAVASLLAARTVSEAAELAGCSERSLYRWLAEDPKFRAAVGSSESVAIDGAVRRLAQLVDLAVSTFEAIMVDPGATHYAALRAADLALSHLVKLREIQTVEARLSALEKVVFSGDRNS